MQSEAKADVKCIVILKKQFNQFHNNNLLNFSSVSPLLLVLLLHFRYSHQIGPCAENEIEMIKHTNGFF